MKKLTALSFIMMILFTGCNSAGQVYTRNYLRSISFDSENIIMTFFYDDMIKFSSDMKNAKQSAEEITGREIFTGHTELVVLNNCDEISILAFLLNEWKVSPDCTVIFDSGDILEKKDTDDITGTVKILEKENKTDKSDIVSTLSRLINHVNSSRKL